jgi:hypothetical protein
MVDRKSVVSSRRRWRSPGIGIRRDEELRMVMPEEDLGAHSSRDRLGYIFVNDPRVEILSARFRKIDY